MKRIVIIATVFFVAAAGAYFFRHLMIKPAFWELTLEGVGTNSSCRAIDLNGDDVLDIVLGGGGEEYESSEHGVVAVDGETGELLWSIPCRNQIVGSAIFKDITGDGTSDVFIGGRSAQLFAIDGSSGKKIWEYLPDHDSLDLVNDTTLLNFFNPVFIPDQDDDGVDDLLMAYGGFVNAKPEEHDRPAGSLMVISSLNGKVLARAYMPDGRETYMSPVVYDFDKNGELEVIFGSGGETVNGALYIGRIDQIMDEDLSAAQKLNDGQGKGFISPAVVVDITNDGFKDFVVNSVNGRVMAYDGLDYSLLWETSMGDDIETYSCAAPFYANDDDVIDLFGNYGVHAWPFSRQSIQVVVDGKSGSVLMRDSLGIFQYASPVVYDFNEDSHEDVMFVVNNAVHQVLDTAYGGSLERYTNKMLVFDIHNDKVLKFWKEKEGTNLGSTPLLIDLDDNGLLDVITCRMTDQFNFFAFRHLVINRIETKINADNIKWGAYQGSAYDGVYHP